MTKSPTQLVVGGVIGVALAVVFFSLLGWQWGLIAVALLLYEGWTIVNRYPGDTISEILWWFSKRPMVPWLFGLGTGWAIASGFIPTGSAGMWITLALGFLQGHFWFQRAEDSEGEK